MTRNRKRAAVKAKLIPRDAWAWKLKNGRIDLDDFTVWHPGGNLYNQHTRCGYVPVAVYELPRRHGGGRKG